MHLSQPFNTNTNFFRLVVNRPTDRHTDGQTDRQTWPHIELLLQLKTKAKANIMNLLWFWHRSSQLVFVLYLSSQALTDMRSLHPHILDEVTPMQNTDLKTSKLRNIWFYTWIIFSKDIQPIKVLISKSTLLNWWSIRAKSPTDGIKTSFTCPFM